jgi:hypothetical protein
MFNTNNLVNIDNSNGNGSFFTNNTIPNGSHALRSPGSNIQSAAGIYPPCKQTGGKINRNKINKISTKYKMKGSKRTVRRNLKRMKSRMLKKYSTHLSGRTRSSRRLRSLRRSSNRSLRRSLNGGALTLNYPSGHSQYQNNNGSLSNTYSLGGPLSARNSALANPPPHIKVEGQPDNLNHYAKNAYGNSGSGSGFASRGWF